VTSQSRLTQVVAGVLAAVLLMGPASTTLALCVTAELGGDSSDAPSSPVTVAVSEAGHHCPGESVDADPDPAVQVEKRDGRRMSEEKTVRALSVATAPVLSSSRPVVRTRAPPSDRSSTSVHISLQTVVLLV